MQFGVVLKRCRRDWFPCRCYLRFSLCSEAIITRCWSQFVSYLLVFKPSSADAVLCLMTLLSLLRCCHCFLCLLFLCRSPLILQLFRCVNICCFGLLQPLLYSVYFAVHAGILCLNFQTCDWSQLHAGIACLAFLAYDWVTACWDSLVVLSMLGQLVYIIACWDSLSSSLAYDWVTACWDS